MIQDQPGKQLERQVADLLRAAGYRVTAETIRGPKKVDLYCEEERRGTTVRIAVECKDYSNHLSQADVALIHSAYRPLYDSGQIDEIFLVTRNGLSPTAMEYVRLARGMSHSTLSELQAQSIDFRGYLNYLIREFEDDGLVEYYVPPQAIESKSLLPDIVDKWIAGETDRPLAILASYGMGKTSFARSFSHKLARQASADVGRRIPILVQLGEISSEQSLEGLLGKLFTSSHAVKGYSFQLFMTLNRSGRFVIFLDGFDEMKHTLSWDEFRFNFSQLNRLVSGESRVVLLGRPTAFLTDDEHQLALHGLRRTGGGMLTEPDWPDYEEVHIAPFSREQVSEFLQKYFDYKASKDGSSRTQRAKASARLRGSIELVTRKEFADIARRPVQLRMLAEVLPQYKGPLDKITTSILYDTFIDLIIERDQSKVARRRFGAAQRREFLDDVAWWLWTEKREMATTGKAIPTAIVSKFCKADDDLEAVRRDLTAACFLERKLGETLYFPHRSFQEFLVAERLLEQLRDGTVSLPTMFEIANPEIYGFLEGLINLRTLPGMTRSLSRYRGTIFGAFANIWTADTAYIDFLLHQAEEDRGTPWWILLATRAICAHDFNAASARRIAKVLEGKQEGELAVLHMLCALALYSQNPDPRLFVTLLLSIRPPKNNFDDRSRLEREFLGRLQFVGDTHIDVRGAYSHAAQVLSPFCMVSDWLRGKSIYAESIRFPERIKGVWPEGFGELKQLQAACARA